MQKIFLRGTLFIILLIVIESFAQKKSNIYWLKPEVNIENRLNKSKDIMLKSQLNYNPSVDFKNLMVPQKISSLINKKSTFFFVFKSSSKEEIDLFSYNKGLYKGYITNRKIVSNKEEIFQKSLVESGIIVNHIFNINALQIRNNGALEFSNTLYNDVGYANNLYELLYFPFVMSQNEKDIIESYLSIKYGISLSENKNYFNSKGDTIWDFKQNKTYNYRVTGIGRDDLNSLYQKQSGNSLKDGLYIGLDKIMQSNIENTHTLSNLSFLLWGDNNLKTSFEDDSTTGLSSMQRVWKINKTQKETLSTQLVINKKQMGIHDLKLSHNNIWLVIDSLSKEKIDYKNSKYIQPTTQNDSLVIFDNVKWTSPTHLFSFIKATDLVLNYKLTPADCSYLSSNGKIEIEIQGGSSPYTIQLYSDTYKKTFTTLENKFTINDLVNAQYTLEVSDKSGKIQKAQVLLNSLTNPEIMLSRDWYLNENRMIKVVPEIFTNDIIEYQWMSGDKLLSTEKEFLATNVGIYKLIVTMKSGCSKELPFAVLNNTTPPSGTIKIYPNPSKINNPFSIVIEQPEPMEISLVITDINGKILVSKHFGKTQSAVYNHQLSQAATYIIIVTCNGKQQTSKLIIN